MKTSYKLKSILSQTMIEEKNRKVALDLFDRYQMMMIM